MIKKYILNFSVILILINTAEGKLSNFPFTEHKSLFQVAGIGKNDDENNWSGGHWNPVTKTIYFCRNKWGIRSFKYHEDKKGKYFSLDKNLEFIPHKKHDFESITQSDLNSQIVWVINENENKLEEYDLSSASPKLVSEWSVGKLVAKNTSFEGLVFVPNSYLQKYNFKDGEGHAYEKAESGRSGIFLLSDQRSGIIYGLDLGKDGKVNVIGSYKLPLGSTRALDLDYESGYLFALDGKKFAAFTLNSKKDDSGEADRKFEVKKLFKSPGPESVEGLAVISNLDKKTISFMVTDDDNFKNTAIRWYEVERDLIFK